jgi:hypothetical protein
MGNTGSNGLVGCFNQDVPSPEQLREMTTFNSGNCSACPANLHQNCNAFGPEWTSGGSNSEGVGCKLTCNRVGYMNTDSSCCYGQQSEDLRLTCDPKMTPDNPSCTAPLVRWCNDDTNISSTYCTQNADVYNKALKAYCTPENIQSKQVCKDWALDPRQQGSIDLVMQQYCQQNPGDGLCCYMQSKIPCPNKFDSRCFNTAAYQTLPMTSTRCPDVLNCNQYFNLDSSSKLFASNIEANCGTKQSSSAQQNTAAEQSDTGNASITAPIIGAVVLGAAVYFLLD